MGQREQGSVVDEPERTQYLIFAVQREPSARCELCVAVGCARCNARVARYCTLADVG